VKKFHLIFYIGLFFSNISARPTKNPGVQKLEEFHKLGQDINEFKKQIKKIERDIKHNSTLLKQDDSSSLKNFLLTDLVQHCFRLGIIFVGGFFYLKK
jgi:hypothetical protein